MSRRRVDGLLSTLHMALVPPARPNPVVAMWRWRYELIGLCSVALVALVLSRAGAVAATATAGAVSAMIASLAYWPAGRRAIAARAWCVVTPHRVRTACAQARLHSTRGRLPAVLCCSPRSYGESVTLWLPAGTTADDLRAARQVIAAACYATKVRLHPHQKYGHIVTLEVIRR